MGGEAIAKARAIAEGDRLSLRDRDLPSRLGLLGLFHRASVLGWF
jgi:hypothetical protein